MFKTILASTALTGFLFVAANAQDAPAPIVPAPEVGTEAPDMPMADVIEESWAPVAIETVAAEELDGADIRTVVDDERIATVGQTVVGPDGTLQGVVAHFGGFLGFGRDQVLLSVDDIQVFKDLDGRVLVRTTLTRDALEAMPEFEG